MLFVIQRGLNGVETVPPSDIIYCVTSLDYVRDAGFDFIFSNGHAVSDLTNFFGSEKVGEIRSLLDWDAIKAKYWKNEKDLDLKRRKEAEFLLWGDLPATGIEGLIAYDETAREQIFQMKSYNGQRVRVRPDYYF